MLATMAKPLVGIIMGSTSDWETMQHAVAQLERFARALAGAGRHDGAADRAVVQPGPEGGVVLRVADRRIHLHQRAEPRVVIDVEQFYKDPEVNPLDLIQTLFTLIEFNKKASLRKIKISVAAGIKTNPTVIKDILSSNIGIYPRGDEFTLDEKMIAAKALLMGEHHVPLKIKDSIKSKKKIIDDPNIITLTPRQNQVLSLIVSRGASNKAIARILKISESTVKLHITAILKKYSLRNRTQLALFCRTDNRS